MERRVHPGNDRTPVTSGYLAAIGALIVVMLVTACATPQTKGTALAPANTSAVVERVAPLPPPPFNQSGLPVIKQIAAPQNPLTVPAKFTLAPGRGPIPVSDLIIASAASGLALRAPEGMQLSIGKAGLAGGSTSSGVAEGALLTKALAELAATPKFAARAPLPVPSSRNLSGVPVGIAGKNEQPPAHRQLGGGAPESGAKTARARAQSPSAAQREVATTAIAPTVQAPVQPAPTAPQPVVASPAPPASSRTQPAVSASVPAQPNVAGTDALPPVLPPVSDAKSVSQASLPVSEHLTGNLGSNMSVSFPGEGWIYLGTADATDSVKFVNKSSSNGETRFLFRIVTPGDYTLMFQRQNLATGSQESRNIAIKIVPPPDGIAGGGAAGYAEGGGAPIALPSSAGATNVAQTGSSPTIPAAGAPFPGKPTAPTQLQQGSGTTGTALWGAAAEKAQGGQPQPGTTSSPGVGSSGTSGAQVAVPPTAAASTGNAVPQVSQPLTAASIPAGRIDAAGSSPPSNVPQFDLGTPAGMLAAATYDLAHSKAQEAEKLLTEYLSKYGYTNNADEAYFLLGKLYEQDSSLRDIRKSIDYYTKLRDQYPFSSYWEEAGKRIQYLTQHFIYIR